jgi:hypothetical protein
MLVLLAKQTTININTTKKLSARAIKNIIQIIVICFFFLFFVAFEFNFKFIHN